MGVCCVVVIFTYRLKTGYSAKITMKYTIKQEKTTRYMNNNLAWEIGLEIQISKLQKKLLKDNLKLILATTEKINRNMIGKKKD